MTDGRPLPLPNRAQEAPDRPPPPQLPPPLERPPPPTNTPTVHTYHTKFLSIYSNDVKLSTLDSLLIKKVTDGQAGQVANVKKNTSRGLLVETFLPAHIRDLLKLWI